MILILAWITGVSLITQNYQKLLEAAIGKMGFATLLFLAVGALFVSIYKLQSNSTHDTQQ